MRTWFLAVCVVALGASAGATVLVPADLGDLSRDAIAIARGRVGAVTSQWTDDRATVETIVTLEVDRYLKGRLGDVVRFRVPGGDLGRLRTIVVGAPQFAVGDHVVVFLGAHGPTIPHLVGFTQGVYRLARAADNSGWTVTPVANLPSANAVSIVRGDRSRRPMPLGEFERHLQQLAGGGR